MTILALQAAKHLSRNSDWRYSNLELQKLIYVAHMFHLGEEKKPLVYGNFEAWEYGPVHPELYHFLKIFGARPIPKTFGLFKFVEDLTKGTEAYWLEDTAEAFPPGNGPRLVAMTHRNGSAWTNFYKDTSIGTVIPEKAIIDEYRLYQNE